MKQHIKKIYLFMLILVLAVMAIIYTLIIPDKVPEMERSGGIKNSSYSVNNTIFSERVENIIVQENITEAEKPVRIPVSAPDSRFVWNASAGAGSTFNLTPLNFDGFYYDLDNNAGGESFSIKLRSPTNRTIGENDLQYSTTVLDIPFKYKKFGSFGMIGFMGERYFAGYTQESLISGKPVNLLSQGLLLRILMDADVNRTLNTGSGMALGDGYVIWVNGINVNEGIVQFSLTKYGEKVDSSSLKAHDAYVFEKDIRMIATAGGSVYDNNIAAGSLPIIALHIDSVLFENNVPVVRIDGIFQLSDRYKKIHPDSEYWIYGIMEITNISGKGISMSNTNSINLRYPYSTEDDVNSIGLMRGSGLKVADSEVLRFIVDEESPEYMNPKLQGAVFTEKNPVMAWDGLNFAGFLYDLDSGMYSQTLEITNISGRSIPAGALKSKTFVIEIPFAVTKKTGFKPSGTNGSYKAIGLGTDTYAVIKGNRNRFAKILVDNGTGYRGKKFLQPFEKWNLGESYNLTINSGDTISSPRRVQIALGKNGINLDEKWISAGSAYEYYVRNSPKENDHLVFVTYLDLVLAGEAIDYFAGLRYTWLVSDNATEIREGDRFGVFKVTNVNSDFIELENDMAIDLNPGRCIRLLGNLNFVVADSEELRFYPSGGKKCN